MIIDLLLYIAGCIVTMGFFYNGTLFLWYFSQYIYEKIQLCFFSQVWDTSCNMQTFLVAKASVKTKNAFLILYTWKKEKCSSQLSGLFIGTLAFLKFHVSNE